MKLETISNKNGNKQYNKSQPNNVSLLLKFQSVTKNEFSVILEPIKRYRGCK